MPPFPRLKSRHAPPPSLPLSTSAAKPATGKPNSKPRRTPSLVLPFLLFLLLPSLVLLSRLSHLSHRLQAITLSTSFRPRLPSRPSAIPSDTCLFIGSDPTRAEPWLLNSRSLCLSSRVCLPTSNPKSAYIRVSNRSASHCAIATAGLHNLGPAFVARAELHFGDCDGMQRQLVTCAHGEGLAMHKYSCPEERTVSDTFLAGLRDEVEWLEDVTILVPEYPFPANIYHYSNVVTYIAFVAARLDKLLTGWGLRHVIQSDGAPYFRDGEAGMPRAVNIVFKGEANRNLWQKGLLEAVFEERLSQLGFDLRIEYLSDKQFAKTSSKYMCIRNAVVLGFRGHVNVWPFANDSAIRTDGSAVPEEAVAIREAVYRDAGILGVDVGEQKGVAEFLGKKRRKLRLPPLIVGYARRLGAEDVEDGKRLASNVRPGGTLRRFSAEDEAWFVEMLRNETGGAGVGLRVFTTRAEEAFADQVRNIAEIGLVVGIHGANLMNAMLIRPFGGLVEVLPGQVESRCYVAGANSGLAYWRYTAEVGEGKRERCDRKKIECRLSWRQREVEVREAGAREEVRGVVRKAVEYLVGLHARFPEGVPVVLDEREGIYVVEGTEAGV